LVCNGYDNGSSVYALHAAGEFTGQRIAAARGQGPEHTDAGHIGRRARGHARAWDDWSIRRPDRAFDCLAVARGLDTRRADGGGQVSPPNWISPLFARHRASALVPARRFWSYDRRYLTFPSVEARRSAGSVAWNLSQNRLKRITRQASWTKPRKLWAWYSQRTRMRRCH